MRNLLDSPLTVADFDQAAQVIYQQLTPSAQIAWPLLAERCGCEVWVKHENHLPTGAFKVRGGLWYLHELMRTAPMTRGIVAATRGNHGQSLAYAARLHGLEAVVVVPHRNLADKNRAMVAYGAELIEHGDDFNAALDHAQVLAAERGLHAMPSFDACLIQGVGTYGIELLRAVPKLDTVYVPVGLGSGICGLIAARNALGLATEIIGVVATKADAYARSWDAGQVVSASADTLADGLAVRIPNAAALAYMKTGAARIVRVTDDAIEKAIGVYFTDTHNIAEGAGAAPLAALLAELELMHGRRVAVILSGGNIDATAFRRAITIK